MTARSTSKVRRSRLLTPDQVGAERAGAGHLGLVVDLDQGVHAEARGLGHQLGGQGVVDHGQDHQDGVGAQRAALGHLPGIDQEVLAQAGQGDRRRGRRPG